jgi:hypothetical protein
MCSVVTDTHIAEYSVPKDAEKDNTESTKLFVCTAGVFVSLLNRIATVSLLFNPGAFPESIAVIERNKGASWNPHDPDNVALDAELGDERSALCNDADIFTTMFRVPTLVSAKGAAPDTSVKVI